MRGRAKARRRSLSNEQASPPGKVRIMEALKSLLREKEFAAITWGDIARKAEVNEGLIYKYFKDTRKLLIKVLEEYATGYLDRLTVDLKGIEGALNKLRRFIWSTISFYSSDRVFAKILLLEVRSFPDYYESEAYRCVQEYSNILMVDIIEDGIKRGEIREDVSPERMRDIVLGAVEHLVMPGIIFDREIDTDELTRVACDIMFDALRASRNEQ